MLHIPALLTLFLPAPGEPLVAHFETNLAASPPANDQFGSALVTDGERLFAGGPLASTGRVVAFRRSGSGWAQEEVLHDPTGATSSWFGWAIDFEGEWLMIGAPIADVAYFDSGATFVFRDPEGDGGWTYVQRLSQPFGDDFFGNAIQIDGQRVLVRGRNTSNVYRFDATHDSWRPEASLPHHPMPEVRAPIALAGDVAVVGYDIVSGSVLDSGVAFIFHRTASGWAYAQHVESPTPILEGAFADSLLLHGGKLFVGESRGPTSSSAGRVHVFAFDGASWVLEQTIFSSDPTQLARFGASLAADGEWLLVGAPLSGPGSAYLFSPEGNGWAERAQLLHPDAIANDAFGATLALDFETGLAAGGVPHLGPETGGVGIFRVEPAFAPFCAGDGSAGACPCGNGAGALAGCVNSTERGARLAHEGTNSVAADDLGFVADFLVPAQPALLFVGTSAMIPAQALGDGLVCASANVVRLGATHADASGGAAWADVSSALGGWSAGDQRFFQAWYRDPAGPCGGGSNLTIGLSVQFVP